MARVGGANFKKSELAPERHDAFWREGLHPSYKYMNTPSHEEQGKTWHILSHTHSLAAKDSSYRPNVIYPGRLLELGEHAREAGMRTQMPGDLDTRSQRSRRSITSGRSGLIARSQGSERTSASGRAQVRAVSMGRTVNQPDIPSFQRVMGL